MIMIFYSADQKASSDFSALTYSMCINVSSSINAMTNQIVLF